MTVTLANAILLALVFVPLTIFLLIHYLRDKTRKRLYLLIAFTFASVAFLIGLVEETILALSGFQPLVGTLFKFFDAFMMIGVFWFFVFLTEFAEDLKHYIPLSLSWLLIVLVAILISPLEIVKQGLSWSEIRGLWAGLAIMLYWLAHFGVIASQFWKHSRYLEEKEPRVRIKLMAGGAVFAVLAYAAVILFKFVFPHLLSLSEMIGGIFAIMAGILFLLGAELPTWLKSLIT